MFWRLMGFHTIHQYPRLLMTKRARWFSQNSHKRKNGIVDPEVVQVQNCGLLEVGDEICTAPEMIPTPK